MEGEGGARVTMTDRDSRKETRQDRWKPGVNGSVSATMTMRKITKKIVPVKFTLVWQAQLIQTCIILLYEQSNWVITK